MLLYSNIFPMIPSFLHEFDATIRFFLGFTIPSKSPLQDLFYEFKNKETYASTLPLIQEIKRVFHRISLMNKFLEDLIRTQKVSFPKNFIDEQRISKHIPF